MKIIIYILFPCLLVGCKLTQSTKKIYKDPRDGSKYGYVEIGNYYWMTENMRYNMDSSVLNPANPDSTFGRLYSGHQALKVCPEGWRLTTTLNWLHIEEMIISDREELYKMQQFRGNGVHKFKSKQYWSNPGTDSLGLNLVPAGIYKHRGKYYKYLGESAFFWTSSNPLYTKRGGGVGTKKHALEYRYIQNDSVGINYSSRWKIDGYLSCRCVRYMTKEEIEERKERAEKLAKQRERQEKRKKK
jgi:uncharacterized protein (TIGR02145 family)